MNAKKVFYSLLAVSFLLSGLVIGAAVLGNIIFEKQFEKLSNLKARSQALEQQNLALAKARQDVEKYTELNEITKQIVPQDKDQALTVREIIKIAQESGITISGISFEPSSLGDSRPPSPKSSDSSSDSQGDSSETTEQKATSSAATSQALTQVQPVPGISGVYSLGIHIETDSNSPVSYDQFLTFLEKLESNRRTAHVGEINITPENGGANVTFSLTLNAFVKP